MQPILAALTRVAGVCFIVAFLAGTVSAETWSDKQNSDRHVFEARFGMFAHGLGSAEQRSVDFNGELVFPKLWNSPNRQWNWLIPRFDFGAMLNSNNATSYIYTGGVWTYDLTPRAFVEPFAGFAVHNGSLNGDATHAAVGCRALYHIGVSAGYRVTQEWSAMLTLDHLSNGQGTLSNANIIKA